MRMPRRASARLERDAGAGRARRIGGLKQRIDPHGPGEPVGWTLARGLRTGAFDVHGAIVTGCARANDAERGPGAYRDSAVAPAKKHNPVIASYLPAAFAALAARQGVVLLN